MSFATGPGDAPVTHWDYVEIDDERLAPAKAVSGGSAYDGCEAPRR